MFPLSHTWKITVMCIKPLNPNLFHWSLSVVTPYILTSGIIKSKPDWCMCVCVCVRVCVCVCVCLVTCFLYLLKIFPLPEYLSQYPLFWSIINFAKVCFCQFFSTDFIRAARTLLSLLSILITYQDFKKLCCWCLCCSYSEFFSLWTLAMFK